MASSGAAVVAVQLGLVAEGCMDRQWGWVSLQLSTCPTAGAIARSLPHPSRPHARSVALTLFNRAVFSVYRFNYPSLVTLLQILISLVYMYALRATGHMQFGALSLRSARKV